MIRLQDVTMSRGGVDLLHGAETLISPGDRLALIGPNGSGKTSLLRLLCGDILPDQGSVEMPGMRISMLEQLAPESDLPGWQYVLAADEPLSAAQRALALAQSNDDGMAIAEAMDAWQVAGGMDAEARARILLNGLGFSPEQEDQPVNTLSGGWRMRLNLARALFRPAELLMLDEPTNHLDLDAILWLEQRLRRIDAILLVVSHDRDFLDAVVTGTLSIEQKRLYRYRGGYSACERQRAERFDRDQRVAEQTQRESDHLKKFIDRFRAQANKARQVQSRIKAMERLVVSAPTEARRRLRLSFDPVGQMPDPVILARDLAAGYGATTILSHVDLKIERGARIGLLGRNGRGKSTLIKTLIGELPLLDGELQRWPSGRVAYFAQDAVDHLQPEQSALEHLRSLTARHLGVASPDGQLRQWLGRFAFQDEDAMRPVGPMSGGERARLVLALCLWVRPQILVLDEPTNHLDADTRDALTESLLAFDGVLLLVSHDRYLLNACVDRFILVNEGGVREFDGDLGDYARLLANGESLQPSSTAAPPRPEGIEETAAQRKQTRREQADRRIRLANALKPLKLEQERLDRAIADLESKIGTLDARIADPALYDDPGAAATHIQERGRLAASLATIEAQWFANAEAQEELARRHEILVLGS